MAIMSDFRNGLTAGDVRKAASEKIAILQGQCRAMKAVIDHAKSILSQEIRVVGSYVGGSGYTYDEFGPSEFEQFEAMQEKIIRHWDETESRLKAIVGTIEGYRDETPLMLAADDYELIFGKDERTES